MILQFIMPAMPDCKEGNWQYPLRVRTPAAMIFLSRAPEGVVDHIIHYGTWPSSAQGFTPQIGKANNAAFDAMLHHIPEGEWLACGLGSPSVIKTVKGRAQVRDRFGRALKSWVLLFLKHGSVKARPCGTVDNRPWALYRELVVLLLEGYQHERGEKRLFHTLEHAAKLNERVAEIIVKLGRTNRTIWQNLLIVCPTLCIVRERVKKQRDHAATQRCAKQISGERPCEYPDWVPDELKKATGYMWHPDNSDNQWWVDAFTIEPTGMMSQSTVISQRGMKQDAVENPVANAGVGTMPKIMVYIAVHAVHGVFVSWVNTGSTMGRVGAYDGFKRWTDDLSDIDKVYVSQFHHFNWQCGMRLHPAFAPRIFGRVEGAAARPATAGAAAVAAVQFVAGHEGPFQQPAFDAKLFLVRSRFLSVRTSHSCRLHESAGTSMIFQHTVHAA